MSGCSALRVAVLVCLCAPASLAHEGHGQPALTKSVLHYLLEPQHALHLGVVALAVALGVLVVRRRRAGPGHQPPR